MFTIKVQVIQNTAHRTSTQASYTIGSGTTMQEKQPAKFFNFNLLIHQQHAFKIYKNS